MNRLPWLGVAVWAWKGVGAAAARPIVWVPFLAVGLLQLVVLLLITGFHHAALLPLGLPLIHFLGGRGADHYPILLYLLPTMFFRANLIINVLIASVAGGFATLLFARAFGFGATPGQGSLVLRRAPLLIGVTLLIAGALLGLTLLGALFPVTLSARSGMVRWGLRFGLMGLFILFQSFLAYTTAWIVLMGHALWPAIRDSVRVTLRTFLPTVIAVGLPALLLFPLSYLVNRVDLVASRMSPEVIGGLIVVEIVCQTLATLVLTGAVTRLFLWRLEDSR